MTGLNSWTGRLRKISAERLNNYRKRFYHSTGKLRGSVCGSLVNPGDEAVHAMRYGISSLKRKLRGVKSEVEEAISSKPTNYIVTETKEEVRSLRERIRSNQSTEYVKATFVKRIPVRTIRENVKIWKSVNNGRIIKTC